MSSPDQEVIVLELRRGRRGKIVISRVQEGSDRYTRLAMMYPTTEADDAPLKRGASLSLRGGAEHDQVASILAAIAKKERANEALGESFTALASGPDTEAEPAATPARRAQHRTIRAGGQLDEEGLF